MQWNRIKLEINLLFHTKLQSKPFSEHTTYENDIEYGKESVDNDCVIIQKQIVNSYPIKPEIAEIAEQWALESFIP